MINEKIKETLKELGLSKKEALPYLLSIYYNCIPNYIPTYVVENIKRSGIIQNGEWIIPLFENQQTDFDWIDDWMNLFKAVNKDRKGTKSFVLSRMKKFFVEYPDIRQQEIIAATKLYLKTVTQPTYLKKSEKFIFEGAGALKTSLLKEWVDTYRERNLHSEKKERHSINVIMK